MKILCQSRTTSNIDGIDCCIIFCTSVLRYVLTKGTAVRKRGWTVRKGYYEILVKKLFLINQNSKFKIINVNLIVITLKNLDCQVPTQIFQSDFLRKYQPLKKSDKNIKCLSRCNLSNKH